MTDSPSHGLQAYCAVKHPPILLGTSSFTATGWQGSFYPKGMRPADYLTFYAQHFHTAEVVEYCYQLKKRGVLIYAYANNHFAGYAPATIEQFRKLWHERGLPELGKPQQGKMRQSLFED